MNLLIFEMKYIVVRNKNVKHNEILDDISDFLWNNGNEVIVTESLGCYLYDELEKFDFVVLVVSSESVEKLVFESDQEITFKNFGVEDCFQTNTILAFSENGVFSNMIPFPHKLFHLEKLEKDDLLLFFKWCRRFNLFTM